jgi:hypothetical protein
MDGVKSLERLRSWMSLEQEFLHKQFLAQANKLDQKELIEILEIVHANYLVRGSLFLRLSKWCQRQGYPLPDADEITNPNK